jgi:ubiquinone/menaquinone biosynthesis C-methylase UbiE
LRIECAKVIDSDFLDSKAGDDYSLQFTGERVVEGKTPDRIWVDHVARYEFAANYVKGKTVLDIACGTGYGSKILIEKNAEKVFGIDLSKESIDFAAENYTGDGLKFMVGDIYEIDFPDNYFDIIVSFETIEHVNDNQKAFSELSRVLNPEGKLIISSPNRKLTSPGRSINDLPNNAFHEIEYTPKEFALILSKYFYINGLYGQRAIKKIFLIPFVEKILRRYQSRLFSLESGSSAVEKIRGFNEYRYISAICAKPKA